MTDYKDKVVVITGAGTGIGYGMAKEFAKRGAKLAISDINDETLRKLEEELKNDGVDVIAYRFDVSNRGQMEKFARMTFDHFKRVDYCMHNAGVTSMGHALKIPETDYFRDFEVNTMGVVYAARSFIPKMEEQEGEAYFIPTISSSAFLYTGAIPAYIVSKHGAQGFCEALAIQLENDKSNVKVRVHSPGTVATEICHPKYYMLDRRDAYFQTEEFKNLEKAISYFIATGGLTVEEYIPELFKQLDEDLFIIRPCVSEEPRCTYRSESLISREGPFKEGQR
ncbi:SDR family NAD(P)-dependent oxidoreductase [uncultured Anaerococcus sp.]|uniref:SDR family NAD(P)-dependent oxidoreductase n=1 Tax=uncultured Anaerococcus sp. TaxID=293428 RepID=UPI002889E369|nr:SDR family NAD(P)-dependent oxidoreductase [uncultured Anaerococcus sp.]